MSECKNCGESLNYIGGVSRTCFECGTPNPNLNQPPRGYSMFSDRNGNTLSVKDMKKVGENP